MRRYEIYLGDAVYVYLGEYADVILYTSDGIAQTNTIVLEPSIVEALQNWIKSTTDDLEKKHEND